MIEKVKCYRETEYYCYILDVKTKEITFNEDFYCIYAYTKKISQQASVVCKAMQDW